VYGLLGAIIGGLATFGGAYWTGHQSQSAADIAARRSAYIEFTAAVDQYRQDLVRLEDSLRQGGKSYDHERSRLDAELPTLFRDAALVKLIGKWPVDRDAALTANSLIDFDVPVDPKLVDHNQLTKAIQDSGGKLQRFVDDATSEFNPQALPLCRLRRSGQRVDDATGHFSASEMTARATATAEDRSAARTVTVLMI
jgi:hypothetical protein